MVLYIAGALSIAMVMPQKDISLLAGLMEAFTVFFTQFHVPWLVPVVALLAVIGAVGQVSTWIVGPVMGLLATSAGGDLPPVLQKVNRSGIPANLLFVQATLVSLFGLVLLLVPDTNVSYWLAADLMMVLYLLMYILLFLTGIRLRTRNLMCPEPIQCLAATLACGSWDA